MGAPEIRRPKFSRVMKYPQIPLIYLSVSPEQFNCRRRPIVQIQYPSTAQDQRIGRFDILPETEMADYAFAVENRGLDIAAGRSKGGEVGTQCLQFDIHPTSTKGSSVKFVEGTCLLWMAGSIEFQRPGRTPFTSPQWRCTDQIFK